MRYLNLAHNQVNSISRKLGLMTSIETLLLCGNQIQAIPVRCHRHTLFRLSLLKN